MSLLVFAGTGIKAGTNYVALSGSGADGLGWDTAWTTLQAALDNASNGDTVVIKQGVYSNSLGQISLNGKSLTIRGGYEGSGTPGNDSGDASLTVLDARTASRLMDIQNCATGLFENLTFKNGKVIGSGSGLYLRNTTNSFVNCVIRDNGGAKGDGAGLYMLNTVSVLDGCLIQNNATAQESKGGGIHQNGGKLTLLSCVLKGNAGSRYQGGALYLTGGQTRLFNCLIQNNAIADWFGTTFDSGAIHAAGAVSLESCTVEGNSPRGIYCASGSSMTVSNSIVWNNGDDIWGTVGLFYSNIQDGDNAGTNGCLSADPQWIKGYFLAADSPCLQAGSDASATIGLGGKYAETATLDSGTLDLGYHHASAFSIVNPDLYVSPGGSDGNNGILVVTPFKSITHALSVAEPGARIHLAAGSYTNGAELFPLEFSTDAVQLLGTNAEITLINATGSGKTVMKLTGVGGGGTLISNVTFKGGTGSTTLGAGLQITCSAALIADCIIQGNTGRNGGGVAIYGGAPVFERCRIWDNTCSQESYGGGFYGAHGSVTIRSSVITRNSARRNPRCGGAMHMKIGMGNVEIANCVIVSNTVAEQQASVGGISSTCLNLMLENVTLADNMSPGLDRNGGAATVRNSILWNNGDDVTGTVSLAYSDIEDGDNNGTNGCVSVNPQFGDSTYYHLKSRKGTYGGGYFSGGSWSVSDVHSPLIDAGDPASRFIDEPSFNGGRINMGAYGNTAVASKSIPGSSGMIIQVR